MSRSLGRKRFWFQQNRPENTTNKTNNQEIK
ncbi:hypothetical protein PMAL9190_02851 [Photobacterium malacitanum]|uniref:Uncharacterized protein n=1 Tax=Photobacterium malacitanum TaxID=2204294 RepID=A0A1Y6MKS2_9GAMM|nr:hypothetical protein PMAL9190_02851 [Photobacterium malacitanum]